MSTGGAGRTGASRDGSNPLEEIVAFAREIADPTRLAILSLLIGEGPQTMSEMAGMLEMAGPRLSNHLARLRSAGLVQVEHSGRQAIYQITGPHIGEALAGLQAAVAENGADGRRRVPAALSPLSQARSCYGHLAGRLGVALFDHLVRQDALLPAEGIRADVGVGPRAGEVMSEFGVQLGELRAGRRRFAFACQDWTERRPHLGGVLGGAVLESLVERGLVARQAGTRALRVTVRGEERLTRLIGSAMQVRPDTPASGLPI